MATYEAWFQTFRPLVNPLNSVVAVEGCMLETFGAELELVRAALATRPHCVWTVVEGNSDDWYISAGFHYVNRVGYVLTELPCDPMNVDHVREYIEQDTLYV